jgi:hypothetical protein
MRADVWVWIGLRSEVKDSREHVLRAGAVPPAPSHRDILATNSSKWDDPRAKLLGGAAWTTAKPMVLASLNAG